MAEWAKNVSVSVQVVFGVSQTAKHHNLGINLFLLDYAGTDDPKLATYLFFLSARATILGWIRPTDFYAIHGWIERNPSYPFECGVALNTENRYTEPSINRAGKPNHVKNANLEKSNEDEKKPQEICEEDTARLDNETAKNVAQVICTS